eukprot:g2845.t1
MDSVAALFFAKQGLRAPWAPSWELALAEWKKNMDFVGEFRAQVSRMQYYTTDQAESEAEKATRAGKTEKLPRETHHHFDSVLPSEDGHGRARYIPSRVEPSKGLDFDGNIVPEDLRADGLFGSLRRVDAVSGVPWFGLPAGDEEDRVGGGVRGSGLGDASWLPVGEPRLFHGLHLAASVRSGEPGPDVVLTSAVPEYPRSPRKDQSAYWEAYPCDYVLVHFARNRDASLLAEYTVAADRRNGIIWRMRLFRPAWAATVGEGGEKNPQLMQDNVLRVEKEHEQ